MRESTKFADYSLDEDLEDDLNLNAELGTIKIAIQRGESWKGKKSPIPQSGRPRPEAFVDVSKNTLTKRAISLSARPDLSTKEVVEPKPTTHNWHPYVDSSGIEDEEYIFLFYYRSKADLVRLGVISETDSVINPPGTVVAPTTNAESSKNTPFSTPRKRRHSEIIDLTGDEDGSDFANQTSAEVTNEKKVR